VVLLFGLEIYFSRDCIGGSILYRSILKGLKKDVVVDREGRMMNATTR